MDFVRTVLCFLILTRTRMRKRSAFPLWGVNYSHICSHGSVSDSANTLGSQRGYLSLSVFFLSLSSLSHSSYKSTVHLPISSFFCVFALTWTLWLATSHHLPVYREMTGFAWPSLRVKLTQPMVQPGYRGSGDPSCVLSSLWITVFCSLTISHSIHPAVPSRQDCCLTHSPPFGVIKYASLQILRITTNKKLC